MNVIMRDLSKLTHEVRFHEKFRGYAYEEVDAYVSGVSAVAAKLQQHLSHLEGKVSELQRRLNEAESQLEASAKTPQNSEPDDSVVSEKLAGVLILAQRVTDQLKSEAETEAQEMLASAYQEAEKIKNDADMAVGMQIQEAQTRGAGIVSEAEAQAELLVSQAKRHASEKADAMHVNALVKVRDLERVKTDLANEIKDLEAKLGNQIWQLNVLWKSLSVCAAELGLETVTEVDAERGAASAYRNAISKHISSASPALKALNALNPDMPDFGMPAHTPAPAHTTDSSSPSSVSMTDGSVSTGSSMPSTDSFISTTDSSLPDSSMHDVFVEWNGDDDADKYAGKYGYDEDYTSGAHSHGYDHSIITKDEIIDTKTPDVVYEGNPQEGNGHQENSQQDNPNDFTPHDIESLRIEPLDLEPHDHNSLDLEPHDLEASQEFYLESDVENVYLSTENEQAVDSQGGQDAEHEGELGEGQDEFLDQLRHVVSSNGFHMKSRDKKQKDMMSAFFDEHEPVKRSRWRNSRY